MSKKVLFVMGPGHCGSTLLDLILGSHSSAFSLGEFHRLWHQLDKHDDREYVQICGVCEGKCPFWNSKVSMPLLRLYFSRKTRLHSSLGKLTRYITHPYQYLFKWSGKSIVIDSSKQPNWIEKQLYPKYSWRGMEPYLVYMCRDGRAVVNSYLRKYPDRGINKITENWMRQIKKMNDFYNKFPEQRKIQVRYEMLATQPKIFFEKLCEFVGIEFEPDMLHYWEHDHHHIFGNGGTRSLIYKYRKQFRPESDALRKRIEISKQFYNSQYYDQLEIAIKLDLRWTNEMSKEDIKKFNDIAGEMNKPFAYEIDQRAQA